MPRPPRLLPVIAAIAALAAAGAGCSRTVVVDVAPAARYGGEPALARARSLAGTVEALARATGNKGRQWAVERRAEELGLAKYVRVEWIDWWTPQKNVVIEIPGRASGSSSTAGSGRPEAAAAGATETAGIVFVIAHYDKIDIRPEVAVSRIFLDVLEPLLSWSYLSQGAVDNGTGCAVVLEIAREVARRPRAETYRCVCFGSEESGLRGSRCYVAGLDPAEVRRVRLVVNV
ncbi:MAG TPA: M28 family peptidase, partial [Planctomycetota bacterium]|nr:M28 family peptidase [Planctomycetota bacterium]